MLPIVVFITCFVESINGWVGLRNTRTLTDYAQKPSWTLCRIYESEAINLRLNNKGLFTLWTMKSSQDLVKFVIGC
jgi:hypothetical protein